MKIKVDSKNKVVIAKGFAEGIDVSTAIGSMRIPSKSIQAVAVCKSDDEFDEEYGEQLARNKFKLKEATAIQGMHLTAYKELVHIINNLTKVANNELKIAESMGYKCEALAYAVDEVIAESEKVEK